MDGEASRVTSLPRNAMRLTPARRLIAGLVLTVVVAYGGFAVAVEAYWTIHPVDLGDVDEPAGVASWALWGLVAGGVAVYLASGVPGYWLTRRRWMLLPAPVLLASALATWGIYGVLNQLGWV